MTRENDILNALQGKGGESGGEMTVDGVISIFCQVTLALLVLFIMASILFMAKAKMDVDEAKGKLVHYRERWEEIRSSKPGQQYELREKALIDLQRQKLLRELDRIDATCRNNLGLVIFLNTKTDGSVWYDVTNVLSKDKIVDKYFISGCNYANKFLNDEDAMRTEWLARVLVVAGMRMENGPESPITKDFARVTKENGQWLLEEIRRRIRSVHKDSCSLQNAAIAKLQKFYRKNPQKLEGSKVYTLIKEYTKAPADKQSMYVSQINEQLYLHAKLVFANQGVPLLKGA